MRTTARRILIPVAALAPAATGCSAGGDEAASPGQAPTEVCGGFAKQPDAAAALEAIAGKSARLTSDQSEPVRVVSELKKAAQTP